MGFGSPETYPKVCNKCGHKWDARKKNPVVCPRCKRYDWNKKKGSK
jgi:predicted Zn-ribbon and HTH transcriptional regulator